jgi:hypothetical protein
MAQPHKGPRTQVNVDVPLAIVPLLERDMATFRVSSTSQYLADLVCHLLGSPDLARELDRRGSKFRGVSAALDGGVRGHGNGPPSELPRLETKEVKLRVPDPVVELVDKEIANAVGASRKAYLKNLICAAYGRLDLASELNRREEQFTLAIVTLAELRQAEATKTKKSDRHLLSA